MTAIPIVVRRHAEEVATLWWRRKSAYLEQGRTRFDELTDFDQLIDAHLDGLKEAGQLAFDVLDKTLKSDAPDVSADLFAALALAYLSEDEALIQRVLERTDALPGKAWALEGVFTWNDAPIVGQSIEAHLSDANPRYRHAALAQCHVHGLDGGTHLPAILADTQSDMVARAIRTAGECGRVDLLPAIGGWLDQGRQADPAIRYWSAWSAILLGDDEGYALGALQSIVLQPHAPQRDALRLLCLWLQDQQLRTYLQSLPQTLTDAVLLVEAIGWSGQAGSAAWLIEQMRIAPLARAAGESFRLITGFDFEDHQAMIEAPPSQSESDQAALYAAYPYPDADKVATWWQANQDAYYKAGSRLLLGRPITLEWLTDILEQGEQAHRELAALHCAILRPGNLLAPTHAHAMIQWLRVQQLKESES